MKQVLKGIIAGLVGGVAWSYFGIAHGADLPLKANAIQPNLVLTTSGFYFGLYTTGGMGSIQGSALQVAPGVNPNTITAVEAAVGGLVGYYWVMPTCATCFAAVEGMFGWQNVNGNSAGFSFSGPASFKQRLLYGADTATIASLFPTLFPIPLPGFPSTLGNVTNIKPYIYAAIDEDDVSLTVFESANRTWSVAPEFGLGALGQVGATTVVDVFAGVKLPQRGVCVGAFALDACANLGTTAVVGAAFKW